MNSLLAFYETIYRPLRLRGRSPNTDRLYRCLLRQFDRFLLRPALVSDLEDLTLARFLEQRAMKGRSPYTVERERCGLLALARLAHSRGLLPVIPEASQAPLPETTPEAWSVEQMRHLAAVAATQLHAETFVPLLGVLWETGERVSAIMETPLTNFRRPILIVPAAARKGRRTDKLFRLSEETCNLLDQVPRPGDASTAMLLPWPHARTLLWDRMKKLVTRAGLGQGRRWRFHAVRRSTASFYAAAGHDSTRLLGHSSPRLTTRWYLDPRVVDQGPQPCDVLPRLRDDRPAS
jgi:site-specific recombinase XerD